jgi:hypothetical protein
VSRRNRHPHHLPCSPAQEARHGFRQVQVHKLHARLTQHQAAKVSCSPLRITLVVSILFGQGAVCFVPDGLCRRSRPPSPAAAVQPRQARRRSGVTQRLILTVVVASIYHRVCIYRRRIEQAALRHPYLALFHNSGNLRLLLCTGFASWPALSLLFANFRQRAGAEDAHHDLNGRQQALVNERVPQISLQEAH